MLSWGLELSSGAGKGKKRLEQFNENNDDFTILTTSQSIKAFGTELDADKANVPF